MKRKHARLILVLSFALFSLVLVDFVGLSGINSVTGRGQTASTTPQQAINEISSVIVGKRDKDGRVAAVATSSALRLHITDPVDQLETTTPQTTLRGFVSDPAAHVFARINRRDLGKLRIATISGVFDTQVTLDLGLNKIVVTSLSVSGATAVASVSATLLQVASSNLMPMYITLGVLALFASLGLIFGLRSLFSHHQPKTTNPWENTQTPKVS